MPRLIVKRPDGRTEQIELGPEGAALVGRRPKSDSVVARAPHANTANLEIVTVADQSVSANHLLAWTKEGSLVIEDVGSRNGTWVLVPPGHPMSVAAGQGEVVVQLGRSAPHSSPHDEPPAPFWKGQTEYAEALIEAIRAWRRLEPLDLEVRVSASSNAPDQSAIPLASGQTLELIPRATAEAGWSDVLETLWRWVARQNAALESEEHTRREGLILASAGIRAAHREVVEAARGGAKTLLLRGPSGAGKEMLAEVFHRHAGRPGPFVAVNCGLFSKELLRSELFGAEAGSFTGATRRIVGAVERAQGGTLFLDEIADMPEDVQPMLLRFLDRREFEQLGQYGRAQRADVLVVAATNKDLRELTRLGKFRTDLWFRLCVHVVEVAGLDERWDDIAAYLETTLADDGQHYLSEVLLPEAIEVLRSHAWEGNFRELTNLRERLPRGAGRGGVDASTCRRALERGSLNPASPRKHPDAAAPSQDDWGELAARATRAFIEDFGHAPLSWDDQKDWNEKYLKPLIFHRLSGGPVEAPADDDGMASLATRTAARLRADRGTALKQLTRFYQRFRKDHRP